MSKIDAVIPAANDDMCWVSAAELDRWVRLLPSC